MQLIKINCFLVTTILLVLFNFINAQSTLISDLCRNDHDCSSHGQCLLGYDNSGIYRNFCKCPSSHDGPMCQFKKCPRENPCQNGGYCELISHGWKCHCQLGFTGSTCDLKQTTACSSKDCNNGVCRLTSTDEAVCDCFYGYTGASCDQESFCDATSCSGHGNCSNSKDSTNKTTTGSHRCTCDPGWTGSRCDLDVDECQQSPCLHGGSCQNLLGSYSCQCMPGYVGRHCETPHGGLCSNNPCLNQGVCYPKFNPQTRRTFTCQCKEGFSGDICQVKSDNCAPVFDVNTGRNISKCFNGGVCLSGATAHKCICPPGFTGPDCKDDINECNLFGASFCKNGGSCINEYGSFRCQCVIGFKGEYCQVDQDDCVSNMCFPGSTCIDKLRRYECECAPDRMGVYCEFENPCHGAKNRCLHGKCLNDGTTGSYQCICEKGFTGKHCDEDIDECASHHISRCYKGTCINTFGSYRCQCERGFEGENCDVATKECEPNPCVNGGTCIDKTADYKCVCMPDWTGKNCEIQKKYSPACTTSVCLHDGVCKKDVFGAESCVCSSRFMGRDCSMLKPDPCEVNHCRNGASCHPTPDFNSFTCECTPGFHGTYCDRVSKSCNSDPCAKGNCIQHASSYQCACFEGFTGVNCEVNVDNCVNNPCGVGICVDGMNTYTCQCPATHTGTHCEVKVTNPCQTGPCLNGGHCIVTDLRGKFRCECASGFAGKNCQIDLHDCKSKCVNGGSCRQGACQCPEGFSGDFCEKDSNTCQHMSKSCQNGGVCENLEDDFYCRCGYGYAGRYCQDAVDVDKFNPKKRSEEELCVHLNCSGLAGNGVCDEACNYAGCGFDGGDCSAKNPRPFKNCPYETYCSYTFRDGHCDDICNNQECLFDGFDCKNKTSDTDTCPDFDLCSKRYGDGTCDPQCNIPGCAWDGGDCFRRQEKDYVLPQSLVLAMTVNRQEFVAQIHPKLLITISRYLRSTVHYQLDGDQNPMIYEYSTVTGQGPLIHIPAALSEGDSAGVMSKRSTEEQNTQGVIIYLLVDVSICYHLQENDLSAHFGHRVTIDTGLKHCFTDTQAAANMLAADSSKNVFDSLGVGIAEARVTERTPRGKEDGITPTAILFSVLAVACFTVLIVYVTHRFGQKRKIVRTTGTFTPPTESDLKTKPYKSNHYLPEYFNNSQPLISGNTSMTASTTNSIKSARFEDPSLDKSGVFSKLHEYASMAEAISDNQIKQHINCVQVLDPEDRTCIHWAVDSISSKVDEDVIQDIAKLSKYGCDVNAQDNKGQTALHLAIAKGRTAVALSLLKDPAVQKDLTDETGKTPLFEAVSTNNLAVVNALLAHPNINVNCFVNVNDTPLMKCARLGDHTLPILARLLEYSGVDVNKTADKSHHEANGRSALHEAAACGSVEIAKALIDKNANVSAADSQQRTPLFLAAESGQMDSVRLLINHPKVDLTATNDNDQTPAQIAEILGHVEVARLLLSRQPFTPPLNMAPGGRQVQKRTTDSAGYESKRARVNVQQAQMQQMHHQQQIQQQLLQQQQLAQSFHMYNQLQPQPQNPGLQSSPNTGIVHSTSPLAPSDSAYGTPSPDDTVLSNNTTDTAHSWDSSTSGPASHESYPPQPPAGLVNHDFGASTSTLVPSQNGYIQEGNALMDKHLYGIYPQFSQQYTQPPFHYGLPQNRQYYAPQQWAYVPQHSGYPVDPRYPHMDPLAMNYNYNNN